MSLFGTVLTAMITPFAQSGELDLQEAKRLARKLANEGSDGIVVTGTTGESPTLTHEEDLLLYAAVLEEVGDRVKVIAGTGSNSTATTIKYTRLAESIGLHGAMIVVPYYNKPSQEGLVAHYTAVAENTNLPLMIYNIPGRTGMNMLPETTLRIIREVTQYKAIKEASGNLDQMKKIIDGNDRQDFHVFSGDDGLTLDLVKIGGQGVVSVASHLVGNDLQTMIRFVQEGKVKEAEVINNRLMDLFKVLFITSNPAPVKAALTQLGYHVGEPRLPLVKVNAAEEAAIIKVMKKLDLI